MKKLKHKPEIPTLLSVLKQIDERIKYRYYVEIDTSPQDKSYFEGILDDVEKLIQTVVCQECQGSGIVNDYGTFGGRRKCDCCQNGIKTLIKPSKNYESRIL